jgi:Domain of unknown function (DUF5615)
VRLVLDHHYSPVIAALLRERDHDVVAAVERDWHTQDDETLLGLCSAEGRALLTNNVADFAVLVRRWQAQGRMHGGLVFTSDASLPRVRGTIGVYVEALDALLTAHPASDALADRVWWLSGG